MASSSENIQVQDTGKADADVDTVVLEMIRSLRFGSVEITVHNGRIVQIERREKLRVT